MKEIPSQYGHWVVGETYLKKRGASMRRVAICQCKCGTEHHFFVDYIHSGTAGKSCGCVPRISPARKHGSARKGKATTEYRSRISMKRRCYDKKPTRYSEWGGRGIRVCARWKSDFSAFLEDMGPKPSSSHSIERRDNDTDYCPDNCFWATPKEQARNTRRSRHLTFNGRTMTMAEWAEEIGIHSNTIRARLDVNGWSVEDALTIPLPVRPKA